MLVIVVGIIFIKAANYTPFIPPSRAAPEAPSGGSGRPPLISCIFGLDPAVFGVAGVIAGAAIVFFAFIGFDVVATTAEETRNPQRDVPDRHPRLAGHLHRALHRGLPGRHRHAELHRHRPERRRRPLATAFDSVGIEWIGDLISVGAASG